MKYYVTYSTGEYDGKNEEEFDTEKEVIDFLNDHVDNSEFSFTVIKGVEVIIEAEKVVMKYKVSDKQPG